MKHETIDSLITLMKFIVRTENAVKGAEIVLENTPIFQWIYYIKQIEHQRSDVSEAFIGKFNQGHSGVPNEGEFKTQNKRTRHEPRNIQPPPIEVENSFAALASTSKGPELNDVMYQKQDQEDTQTETTNNNDQIIKPPPITIRYKKTWPITCQYLKNQGIRSEKNFNTKDGVKM
ncbi:hypothetical protein JTB14_027735 [Gonioctena quinquepunctata]|nr:hypothetical protein JTB14_027735 [Gonioctena quinquepunctata]